MSRIKCGYFTIRGRSFYVYEGVNTIGRDKQANVIVKDIGVSQQQALLIAVDEKHYISDFNSSNGTHINDEKLVPFKLYEIGDGSVVFFSVDVEATYRKISKIKPTDTTIDITMTQNTQEETLYAAKTQLFNEASFLTNVTEAAQSSQITQASGSKTGDNSRIFAFPDDGLTFNSLNTQKLINQSEDINELPTQIVSTNNNTTSKCDRNDSTIYDIPDDGLTFNSLNTQNLESEAIQDMPTQIIESVGDPSTIHNLPTQIVKNLPSKNDSSSNSNSAIHELPTQINKPAAGINNSGIHELPTQINKPAAGINNSGIHELPTQINKPDTSTSSKCLNEDLHEASTLILNNESEVSINDAETQLFPMLGIHDQPTQLTNIGDGSCSTAENSNRAIDLHEMETQLITQESSKISSSIDRDALELFMNLKENENDTSKDTEQRSIAKNVNEDSNVEAGPSTRSRRSNLAVDQSICNESHRVTRSRKQASNSVEGVNNAHLQKVDESLGNADLPNTGQSRVVNVDKTAVIPVEEEDTEVYDSDATQEYVNSNNDNDNLVEIASSSTNIQQSRASSSTAENNVKSKESFNEHFNTDSNSNDSEDFLANSSALDEIRNQDDADLQSQTRKLKRHIGSDDENVDSDTQSQLPMHLVNIRTKASRLNSDDEEMVDSDPQSQIPVHLLKKRTSSNRLDSDDLKIGKDKVGDASGSDTEIEELGENDETNNGNDSDTDVEDLSKNDNSVQNEIARNSTTRNNKDACNINPQIAEPIFNISKTANNSGGKLFNVETANITESKANNSTLNATPSIIDCSDIDMDDSRTNMNESTDIEDSFVKRRSILADISSEFIPSTQDMANISTRNSFIAGQLSTIVDVTEHDCSDSFRLGLTQDDIALDESRTSSVDFAGTRNETANFDFDAPTQKIVAQSNEDCFKKPLPNTSGISRSSKRKTDGDSFNESELFGADTLVTDDDDDELFVAATQQLDETNNRKKALNDSDIFREATQKCDQPVAKTRNSLKSAIFSAESEPFNDSDIFIAATQKLNETADLSSPKSISGNKNTSLRNVNQLDNSTEMLFGADTQKLDNQDGLDDSLFAAATQKVTETARNLNTQDTVTVVDSHSFNFEKECLNRSVDSESRKRVSFGKVEDIHLPKPSTSGDISKSNASNSDGKNNSGVESQLEVMFDTENLHFDESAHENGSRPINPIGTTFEECTTQDVLNILDHTNNTGKDEAIPDKGTESTVKSNKNIVKKIEAPVTPLRRTNRKLSKVIDDEQEEHGNKNEKTVPKNECVRTPLRRTNRKLSNVINDNEQEEINRKETKVKNVLKINKNVNSECTGSPLRRTNRKLSKDVQVENSTDINKRDENETLDEYKLVSSGTPSKRTVRKSSRNFSNDERQEDKTAGEENSVVGKSETKVAGKIKNTRLSKLATIKINETEEDNSIMENLSIINLMKNETKKANLQTTNAASSSVAVEESSVKTDDASTSSSSVPEDTSRRRTTRVRKTILNSLVEETVEPVKKRATKKAPPAARNTRKRKSSTSDEEAAIKVSVPKYQKRMVLSEETINETALSATLVNVSVPAPVNKRGRKKNVTKVIFTMLDSPQLQKLVRTLGGVLADSIKDSTVLVTKSILRTVKLLSAVGYGIPICSPQWLEESSKANTFLDPWEYLLQDEEAEKKWGFSLKESFKRSRNKKLFEGYTFVLFSTYAPETIKGGIESCGGRCLTKPPKDGDFIIVAAEENHSKYSKYLKQNVKVVLPEAILDGVLRQEIHFDDHLLT